MGGAHGAYLKGWRNASPAFSAAMGNASTLEAPVSATTIWVARVAVPLERDHVTRIVACVEFHKHAWLLWAPESQLRRWAAGLDATNSALPGPPSHPWSCLGLPRR